LDERDCRILIELTRAPFASLADLGRALGVSATAAKARLDRLADAGTYRGLVAAPAARALGKHDRLAVWSRAPPDAEPAQLLAAPEVAWASRAYPTSTVAMLYRDDPDAPLPRELLAAAGRAPDAVVTPADPSRAADHLPLSPLDWRIVDALLDEPRATARALAARAGLSARTARARRDALLASGLLGVFPSVDATLEEGSILYNAYVALERPEDARALRLADAHRIVTHHAPPAVFLVGFVRTYAEAHVAEEKLRAAPGVRDVTFSVPQGTLVARDRVAAWTRAEIAKWDRARRRPLAGTT
jgi:DNA-binding Lrp family transcriptional regulator